MKCQKFASGLIILFLACLINTATGQKMKATNKAQASKITQTSDYNILAFGAIPDGTTNNTKAVQNAIDAANAAGGGIVTIPTGKFKIGTIFIKSYVTLNLTAGATLFGSADIKDYTAMTWGGDGNIDRQPFHLIAAKDAENIAIIGSGKIDGNGTAYFENATDNKYPRWIKAKKTKVSPMVEISNCKNIRIENITLTNPAGWTCHLLNPDKATINGIKIDNDVFTPNSDGIDITGGNDVMISNCYISTCDDAICLKTSPDSRECKRITVTNCIIKTMCVALKIGNESYKDISQVTFSNCVVYGSSRAIGIYSQDGAVIEDVAISNIVCDTKAPFIFNRPIHISLLQMGTKRGAINNVSISNFISQSQGRVLITAEEGSIINNLTLRDIQLTFPYIEDPTPYVEGAKSKQFSPRNLNARKALAAVVAENVSNLVVDNLNITWPKANDPFPENWKYKELIEHGGDRVFTPTFDKTHEIEFSAVYGRGLKGGYIHVPLAQSSAPSAAQFDILNSSINIKE